jgi:hypothetical protein
MEAALYGSSSEAFRLALRTSPSRFPQLAHTIRLTVLVHLGIQLEEVSEVAEKIIVMPKN